MSSIRQTRRRLGLSQVELAEAAGVSPATVVEIERGHRQPQGRTLRKLAAALSVEVADLVEEEVGSPKDPAPLPLEPAVEEGRPEVDPWTASWIGYIRRRAARIQETASNEASPEFGTPQSAFSFVTRCNEEGGDMYETIVEDMPADDEPFDLAPIDEIVAALEDFSRAIGQAQGRAWMLKATAPEDAIAQKRAKRSAEEVEKQRARLPDRLANHA